MLIKFGIGTKMNGKRAALLVTAVLVAALVGFGPRICAAAGKNANPHLRDGCLHCHRSDGSAGQEGTLIFSPGTDGPHAVLAHSCRTCHKEGKENFWIIVLPKGTPGSRMVSVPSAPAPPSPPVTAGLSEEEGFANTHDTLECTKCHSEDPGTVKAGLPAPFPYGDAGVDAFCMTCHSGIDQSHFPRGNRPRRTISCLNCHQVHGHTLLFPALRDEYPVFLIESTDINPHGGKIFCLSCHLDSPQGGQVVNFRGEGDSSALCQRCHQEVEHHPLGVKSSPGTWKMDFSDFPLEEEKVTCVTCHDPYECESINTRDNPRFLRGGPYNAVEEFCTRCHEGRSFGSQNPHDQIDDKGEVRRKQCLYCHTSIPEGVGYTLRPEDFTDTMEQLCVSCHPVPPHPDVDHMVEMTPKMQTLLTEYEERRLVSLPLDSDVILTCVTCHNPHERGLLKGPSGVGADEEKRLRLATFNEICTPCHGRH